MEYTESDISNGLTEEQIRDNVTKIYTKVNNSFASSMRTDGKRIKFSVNDFLDGVTGRMQRSMNVPKKYSAKQTNTILEAPYNYKDDLIRMSMYFYIRSQEYKGIIEYKSSMLTYANTVYPYGIIGKDFDKENYYKNLQFVDDYNLDSKLALTTKILVREDVYFAYEISDNSGKHYIWKRLPSEYCRIIGQDRFETYRIAFDMKYFVKYPEDLEKYPPEFKEKYNLWKGQTETKGKSKKTNNLAVVNKEDGYVELDGNKAIAFKFDESVDYVIPYYAGMFIDLIRLSELKDVEIINNVADNYKLLHQLVPMGKNGEEDDYLISGDFMKAFHSNLVETVPDGVGVATTPMKVEPITLKGNVNSAQESITSKQVTNILTQSGTSSQLFNGSSTSALGLNKNIQVDENMMFKVLRQYEKFMNKRLYFYNKETYKTKINFLNHTHFNTEALFGNLLKAGQAGFNTEFEVNAVLEKSQIDFMNSGTLMDILGIKDKMNPFKSSHVGDGSEEENGGKKTETAITEDGLKSRDRDL